MGSLRQLYWQQRIERREISAAAKVIQNAYRQYKRRAQTRQKQMEVECRAAVVIQTYYRRYKQYCYSRKLHQAASRIQRQFRLYKSAKRKSSEDRRQKNNNDSSKSDQQPLIDAFTEFLENTVNADSCMPGEQKGQMSNHDGDNICCSSCSIDDNDYWDARRQKAAMRIQHAFRGHRKRLAAAAGPSRKFRRLSASSLTHRQDTPSPTLSSN